MRCLKRQLATIVFLRIREEQTAVPDSTSATLAA
jgi:hypothetical protein